MEEPTEQRELRVRVLQAGGPSCALKDRKVRDIEVQRDQKWAVHKGVWVHGAAGLQLWEEVGDTSR